MSYSDVGKNHLYRVRFGNILLLDEGVLNYMIVIEDAWVTDYQGLAHTRLYENINDMDRSKHYSNTVAIVQSSGAGKSRMVDMQATVVFTLPFCIRDPEEDYGTFLSMWSRMILIMYIFSPRVSSG